jgi:hypothetical protein
MVRVKIRVRAKVGVRVRVNVRVVLPKKPNFSFHISFAPFASALILMALESAQNRVNTEGISPPNSMEIILQWSGVRVRVRV